MARSPGMRRRRAAWRFHNVVDIIAPKSEAVLIEAREEIVAVAPQQEAVVVESRTEMAIIAPPAGSGRHRSRTAGAGRTER